MTRKAFALLALLCAAIALVPTQAGAQSVRQQIIDDCQDGQIDGSFTPAQLRDARQNLPGDVAQYTDCEVVLRQAEISDRPGSSGGGTGSSQLPGSTGAPAPAGVGDNSIVAPDRRDAPTLEQARTVGAAPVLIDPDTLKPGAAIRLDRASATLPTALVVALALLLAVALALAAPAARRRLRRSAPTGT